MNKAQIKVELNDLITIDNTVYHVAEHPALPGVPYVQRGARGFVIQLKSPGPDRFALKYFKLKYRVPELVGIGKALRQYADLPGLRAAYRTVFTAPTHPELIRKYPALEYGVLMPWLPGMTWFDVISRRAPLAPLESLQLAQQTGRILATLEAQGLAHCDIAGANVMVERAAKRVELVDIEEMHGPGLPRPVELPAGQEGYQHQSSATNGQWSAEGDRFGGAVLIAEMLGWQSAKIRDNSADEHYFAATEMQQADSPRYKLLQEVLRAEYAPEVADVFETAWRSPTLADCPPLTTWRDTLDRLDASQKSPAPITSAVVSGRRSLLPTTAASPTMPVPVAVKLCPRCGAQNSVSAEFCQKCHFYLRGEQRPARTPLSPANSSQQPTIGPASQPMTLSNTPPPEIVSARRLVAPGQPGQTVPTTTPEPSGSDGRWIIAALVIGFIITLLIFALLPH